MLFKKTILLVFIIFSSPLFAQVQTVWTARFGGVWGYTDFGREIHKDQLGNIYVAGHSLVDGSHGVITIVKYNPDGVQIWFHHSPVNDGMEDFTLSKSGNLFLTGYRFTGISGNYSDMLTEKLDSSGNVIWTDAYNGPSNSYDYGRAIAVDDDENVYVTGYSLTTGSNYDFITIKYNNMGQRQWVRRFSSSGNYHDFAHDITLDQSGNIYVAGYSATNWENYNITLVKYNSNGDTVWVRSQPIDTSATDYTPAFVEVDNSGNPFLAGVKKSQTNGTDILLTKYNSSGVEQWAHTWKSSANENDELAGGFYGDHGMALDNNGNVFLAGTAENKSVVFAEDIITLKYSPSGTMQWSYIYDGGLNEPDDAYSLAVDDSGNVYVCGSTCITNSFICDDYVVFRLNKNGTRDWIRTYNGTADWYDVAYNVLVDADRNVFVTGVSSTEPVIGGDADIITIKYSQNPTGVQPISGDIPKDYFLSQNFPNPFNPATNIKFELPKSAFTKLTVYNMLGEEVSVLVNKELQAGNYEVNWNASKFSSGVYFYRLAANDYVVTKKMMLVK